MSCYLYRLQRTHTSRSVRDIFFPGSFYHTHDLPYYIIFTIHTVTFYYKNVHLGISHLLDLVWKKPYKGWLMWHVKAAGSLYNRAWNTDKLYQLNSVSQTKWENANHAKETTVRCRGNNYSNNCSYAHKTTQWRCQNSDVYRKSLMSGPSFVFIQTTFISNSRPRR